MGGSERGVATGAFAQTDHQHTRLPLLYLLALLEGKGTAIFRAHFRRRRLQLENDAQRKNCQRTDEKCGLKSEDHGKIIFATFSKGMGEENKSPAVRSAGIREHGDDAEFSHAQPGGSSVTFLGDLTTGR